MTIIEKHQTENKLIDEAMNELTKVMQRIGTLETAAEEYRRAAEKSSKGEMMKREMIEQLEEQLVQEQTKCDALSMDLERMTAERNQLQTEIRDIEMSINKQMALRDAEKEQLRAGAMLRKFIAQIQDLTQSALGGTVQIMKEAV